MNASALFTVYYAAAIVLLGTELFVARPSRGARTQTSSAVPYVVALAVAYACQLALIWYGATSQTDWAPWRSHLPLPVITRTAYHAELIAIAVVALTAFQSWALFAIYRRRVWGATLVAGAAALLVLSLAEPALISPDTYSYVADAMLGSASYVPPATPFAGEYRVINDALGTPLPPSPYGPMWIWIARAVVAAAPTLLAKLLCFRAFGALAYGALFAALVRLKLPNRILAVTALNPGLMLQYVTNAHNEIFCLACVAWAAVLVRRAPLGSVLLVVAAATVKAPFAILGAPVFIRLTSVWSRSAWVGTVVALSVVFALLAGGGPYLRALVHHLPYTSLADILGSCVAAAALTLLVVAVWSRRRLRAAVWSFPLMASYPTPWYAAWGFGYALTSRRTLGYLLVWFPFCSALVDTMFMQLWTLEIVVPVATVACVLWMLGVLRVKPA